MSILVVGAVRLYREGIVHYLNETVGPAGVETADSASHALARVASSRPDVALVDLALDEAFACVRELASRGVPVIALGIEDRDSSILAAAEAGISGYVTRDGSLDDLVETITSVARSELRCPPRVSALLIHRVASLAGKRQAGGDYPRLTPRENEIVVLLEQGLSNKEISAHLCIEVTTVKNHVHNALEKLGVSRRGQAPAALRRRLGSASLSMD